MAQEHSTPFEHDLEAIRNAVMAKESLIVAACRFADDPRSTQELMKAVEKYREVMREFNGPTAL